MGAALATSGRAELRTLTDKQGRTIQADVIAVENDVAKIKRDDGQTFDLPLAQLSDADQSSLREWAKKQAAIIPKDAIQATFGRGMFDSEKPSRENVMRYKPGSSTEMEIGGAITKRDEKWGYSVTLVNKLMRPITDVRIEYQLLIKPDPLLHRRSHLEPEPITQLKGVEKITELGPRAQVIFKTKTVRMLKHTFSGEIPRTRNEGRSTRSDTLIGIRARIYVGKQLINEVSSSESLPIGEKW